MVGYGLCWLWAGWWSLGLEFAGLRVFLVVVCGVLI